MSKLGDKFRSKFGQKPAEKEARQEHRAKKMEARSRSSADITSEESLIKRKEDRNKERRFIKILLQEERVLLKNGKTLRQGKRKRELQ